jgi:hypothetical protein
MRTRPHNLGLALAAAFALPWGNAFAAPDECLRYPDNPTVAACASQYGPGSPGPRARGSAAAQPGNRSVPVKLGSELRTVAVVPGGPPPPAPEPPPPTIAVDHEALIYTIVAGAVGASLLILAAFGAWKWSATLTKPCPYCGARLSRSAHACRSCFRAV